jgi:hypothetical protein
MILNGRDMKFYTGDGLRVIGCETSCTLSITSEEIITTSKGSGRGTNREYGRYDWQIDFDGAVFNFEGFPDGSSYTHAMEMAAFLLQGLKVGIKIEVDTSNTSAQYYYGRGIVTNVQYVGQADGVATYSGTVKADGVLWPINSFITNYTGLKELTLTANATDDSNNYIESVTLYNQVINFILKNGVLVTDGGYTFSNAGSNGRITMALAQNDVLRVFYQNNP